MPTMAWCATVIVAGWVAGTACTRGTKAPPVVANESTREPGADPAIVCDALDPTPINPVLGQLPRKPARLVGQLLDGTDFDLARLRGQVVLVSFQASWDMLTQAEQPTFAALAPAISGLAIVRVASENTREDAVAGVAPGAPYQTVFDRYRSECGSLGAIAASWGVSKVPESFLVDRAGNVRFYFVSLRDWSTPDAIACVRAVAEDSLPLITSEPEQAGPPVPCVTGP